MRKMKNSGVEWIGEIPVEWSVLPTKRFFRNVKRVAGKDADNYERLALTLNGECQSLIIIGIFSSNS